ncbi:hypothetical protein BDK51DRAFT_35090, partial [Blyttiomyces helicus]
PVNSTTILPTYLGPTKITANIYPRQPNSPPGWIPCILQRTGTEYPNASIVHTQYSSNGILYVLDTMLRAPLDAAEFDKSTLADTSPASSVPATIHPATTTTHPAFTTTAPASTFHLAAPPTVSSVATAESAKGSTSPALKSALSRVLEAALVAASFLLL